MVPWVVIGISGVTCGGKSTLTTKLQERFPDAVLIQQDDYFLPEDSERHVYLKELHHANWDILSSIDMDGLHQRIVSLLSQPHPSTAATTTPLLLLLIDGHLVLNDRRIEEMCDKKYYFLLPKKECWKRRSKRHYQPPDPPGYFDQCVWPMHEKYRDILKNSVQDIVFLDGMKDEEEIFQSVIQDIQMHMNNIKSLE